MSAAHPTILFQCPNRIGLGHLSRLSAIALAIREHDPAIRLPFVVEGHSHELLESHGLPYLSVPTRYELTRWWLPWADEELENLTLSLALLMVKKLRADLVVFDCLPHKDFVRAAREFGVPMVLCLRKIKELDAYLAERTAQLQHMDSIVLPHLPGEVALPEALARKAVFVGPIVRPLRKPPADTAPRVRSASIIITGGGGGYPNAVEFFNTTLRGFAELRRRRGDVTATLVTGPLFRDWARLRVVDGVTVVPFHFDLPSMIAEADLVISQAGYNTLSEIGSIGTRAICIPAERKYDDQFERAAAFARRHRHVCVFTGSSSDLAAVMEASLRSERCEPEAPAPGASTSGSRAAARHICRRLGELTRAP